jgi:phosphoadenosine phosphosulfate reductase
MDLKELSSRLEGKSVIDSLKELAGTYPGKVIFTTSLGIEDQVITHLIFRNEIPIEVVTLDTGRLFPETYHVLAETVLKYRKKINLYFPDHDGVERLVTEKGPFSFYESKENRLECCHIRKVIPLNRAIIGKSVWITGIRSEQSDNRSGMGNLEYDDIKKIIKFHPLFYWTLSEVETFLKNNDVPFNALHDKGYLSIGCEPCTRPVTKGQDFRSGRWWWETDSNKECGCHVRYTDTNV